MENNINPELRKPRRLKGTPSFRYRNYFACAVLAFGAVSGLIFNYFAKGEYQRRVDEGFFDPSEALLRRKHAFQKQLTSLTTEELHEVAEREAEVKQLRD